MNSSAHHGWIEKAEHDLKIAKDEYVTDAPVTDMICFHAQQCVEKYLKAYLVVNRIVFRKTHVIAELVETCKERDPGFEELYKLDADRLTSYGTEVRYPDDLYFRKNIVTFRCKVEKPKVKIQKTFAPSLTLALRLLTYFIHPFFLYHSKEIATPSSSDSFVLKLSSSNAFFGLQSQFGCTPSRAFSMFMSAGLSCNPAMNSLIPATV